MFKCTLLHHETIRNGYSRRASPTVEGCLRPRRQDHETGGRKAFRGVYQEGQKKTEEITRIAEPILHKSPSKDTTKPGLPISTEEDAALSQISLLLEHLEELGRAIEALTAVLRGALIQGRSV
jgi:hypothetical protein